MCFTHSRHANDRAHAQSQRARRQSEVARLAGRLIFDAYRQKLKAAAAEKAKAKAERKAQREAEAAVRQKAARDAAAGREL